MDTCFGGCPFLREGNFPARFIRLYATRLTYHGSNGTGYGIAIAEMEVYGTKRVLAE